MHNPLMQVLITAPLQANLGQDSLCAFVRNTTRRGWNGIFNASSVEENTGNKFYSHINCVPCLENNKTWSWSLGDETIANC